MSITGDPQVAFLKLWPDSWQRSWWRGELIDLQAWQVVPKECGNESPTLTKYIYICICICIYIYTCTSHILGSYTWVIWYQGPITIFQASLQAIRWLCPSKFLEIEGYCWWFRNPVNSPVKGTVVGHPIIDRWCRSSSINSIDPQFPSKRWVFPGSRNARPKAGKGRNRGECWNHGDVVSNLGTSSKTCHTYVCNVYI